MWSMIVKKIFRCEERDDMLLRRTSAGEVTLNEAGVGKPSSALLTFHSHSITNIQRRVSSTEYYSYPMIV